MDVLLTLVAVVLALVAVVALTSGEAPGDVMVAGAPLGQGPEALRDFVPVPEATPEAIEFARTGNWVWLAWWGFTLAFPLIFVASGAAARLRDAVEARAGGRWWLALAAFLVAYIALEWLAQRPLAFATGYWRLHAYGLSNQTLGKWLWDSVMGLGVTMVFGGVVLLVPLALMRWSPRRWWLLNGLLALPGSFLLLYVHPLVVAPLFNDFGPMKDKALEARILDLAERCGIEGGRVFEVAKKVDTKAVNAYVSGFAGSKRIVLWDTLLERLDEDEVLFIMGHEMGHYVLGHMTLGLILGSLGAYVLFGLVHLMMGEALRRRGEDWGLRGLGDPATAPLFAFCVTVVVLVGKPLEMQSSRFMEHEADRFGLEVTRDNRAAAGAFVKLQQSNLAIPWPGPLRRLFRATHPPLGERIVFCNTYRPWEQGRGLYYGRYLGEGGAVTERR